MQEQWVRWEPLNGLSKKYAIESVTDNGDGLKIVLHDEFSSTGRVCITYHALDFYKWTDITFKRILLRSIKEQYGANFYNEWTFFEIKNSEYVQTLARLSCFVREAKYTRHFVIITSTAMFDLSAGLEGPTCEFID